MKLELKKMNNDACNDYLNMCLLALNLIKKKDVCSIGDKIYERNLMMNFAYQFGVNSASQNCKEAEERCYNLISGEIGKKIGSDEALQNWCRDNLQKAFSNSQPCVFPDFVIHGSYFDYRTESQHLIVEAKTTHNLQFSQFAWDFAKLNRYVSKLNFQSSVYLIVGIDENKVNNFLKQFSQYPQFPNIETSLSNIYIIIRKDMDAQVQLYKVIDSDS